MMRAAPQKSSASIRCACTSDALGDQANTVKRPSCEAISASASRWSCTNCAAERWRVPPSRDGETIAGPSSSTGSVTMTCSTGYDPERRAILAPNASTS